MNDSNRRRKIAALLSGLLFFICAVITVCLLRIDKSSSSLSLFLTLTLLFGGLFAGQTAVLFARMRQ